MPVATIDPASWEKRELKSLEGAYIMVRPLPYGKKLERRDKATRMFLESESGKGKTKKDAEKEVNRLELETLNKWARLFDFRYCIGEHNLTDSNGAVLELGREMTLASLNPKVGDEIESILDAINNEEDEVDSEDFPRLPLPSLEDEAVILEDESRKVS